MKDRGEIAGNDAAPGEDILPEGFWDAAEATAPTPKTSVHLKLDPEVFAFFKAGGKGHLTRMQNVLKAYVRAQGGTAPRS